MVLSYSMKAAVCLLTTHLVSPSLAQTSQSPIRTAPAGVPIQLTTFGERPSWSPDGSRLAFMSHSYGNAFEIDLATQQLTLLTSFPNAGFLRAQYLPNGDLFLIGARFFDESFDVLGTRVNDQEMWVLPRGSDEPVALNESIYEGVAISRQSNLIAFAQNFQSNPDQFAFNESALYTAEIVYSEAGVPSLANKRELRRAMSPNCTLEAQDFRINDTELIYNCYPQYVAGYGSVILNFNLETNETTTVRALYPEEFNESEGIYPDGEYILVESDRDNPSTGDDSQHPADIWRLSLEPPYEDMVRLTFFAREPPNKAGNPVVSPDGRTMALQIGRLGSQIGAGFGIMIMGL